MSVSETFLIAKFGNESNLKKLKDGNIFFNSIQTYREDGTDYRGDSMEGRIPIDPKKLKIYDDHGENIFDKIPYPDKVTESVLNDENLMMFCAATITKNIMTKGGDGIWYFKDEFKNAVRHFGDNVLLMWSAELLDHLDNATDAKGQRIGCESGMILYRDLNDFAHTDEYRRTGSPYDRYFVKSRSYKNQNEWRVIIDGHEEPLVPNCGGGFILKTTPFKFATMMKTSDFLNGAIELSED